MSFDNHDLLKAIAVTAELTGTELSEHGLEALEQKLKRYPLPCVFAALDRCQEEGSRLTLHAVKTWLEEADGRPRADEAWAIAFESFDEDLTVVLTAEMSKALYLIRPLLAAKDKIAARRAFIEIYERFVRKAREQSEGVEWNVQLGRDRYHREEAILAAIEHGKLNRHQVAHLIPIPNFDVADLLEYTAKTETKDLTTRHSALKMLAQLRSICLAPSPFELLHRAKRNAAREQENANRQRLAEQIERIQ